MYSIPEHDNAFNKYDEPRLHMERLLQTRLVEFDLSLRILIPLESKGILTIGDLTRQSRHSLRKIKNIGATSVNTLSAFYAVRH